uniref:Myb/SANT-like DNA-binding domain-containing protein n=1 Tax=Equus asinus TaxID=9793 RepID=A0A9L0IBL6_EQUAS
MHKGYASDALKDLPGQDPHSELLQTEDTGQAFLPSWSFWCLRQLDHLNFLQHTLQCPINELEIKTGVREQRPKNAKEAVAVVENVQRVPGQQGETGLEDLAAEKMRIRGNDRSPVQTEDGVLDQAGGCGEGEKRTDARDLLKVLDSGKDLRVLIEETAPLGGARESLRSHLIQGLHPEERTLTGPRSSCQRPWEHSEGFQEPSPEEGSLRPGNRCSALDRRGPAGVHWGYEETMTVLAILSNSHFYEKLQAHHQNIQIYRAMAAQLQEQGFLRTPEQCLTKFKNLQSCYFKVRRGHMPEPCIFHEEMDVLSSSWASVATVTRPRGK